MAGTFQINNNHSDLVKYYFKLANSFHLKFFIFIIIFVLFQILFQVSCNKETN